MKYLSITTLLVIAVGFSACKKEQPSTNNEPKTNFTINGVSNLTIPANFSDSLFLNILHVGGDQENVKLTLTGLPDKVTHKFSADAGTPTFSSRLIITGDYATIGTYPLKLTATSTSGVVKNVDFDLIVAKAIDCAGDMAGSYPFAVQCAGGSPNTGNAVVIKEPGTTNEIQIQGVMDFPVKAILDCAAKTITIPSYTDYGTSYYITINGSGTFLDNYMKFNISYTTFVGGSPAYSGNCEYTLTR